MEVPDSILDFVAEVARTERQRIHADTRIREDLGLDGETAVDFFASFGVRFAVDMHPIYADWKRHFLLPQAGLGYWWIAIGSAAILAAGALRELSGLPLFWTVPLLLSCGYAWYQPGTREWRLGVASVLCSLLAYVVHIQLPLVPEWAAVPLLLLAFWEIERRTPRRETAPIFVRDLVHSAATGKWEKGDGPLQA